MLTVLLILLAWCALSAALVPVIGRYLARMRDTQSTPANYVCPYCAGGYPERSDLARHMLNAHSERIV